MTTMEMRVHMDCAGCESKVKAALENIKGVDSVETDMALQKVTVTGWACSDQKKVLKRVRRTGVRAEIWELPYNPKINGPVAYFAPPPSSSYNYYKHGSDSNAQGYYNHHEYSSIHSSTVFGHQTGAAFSDENPHGCSIM